MQAASLTIQAYHLCIKNANGCSVHNLGLSLIYIFNMHSYKNYTRRADIDNHHVRHRYDVINDDSIMLIFMF